LARSQILRGGINLDEIAESQKSASVVIAERAGIPVSPLLMDAAIRTFSDSINLEPFPNRKQPPLMQKPRSDIEAVVSFRKPGFETWGKNAWPAGLALTFAPPLYSYILALLPLQ